jgi:acetyl-CoA carboxylase biotin carboxyl carrier protein
MALTPDDIKVLVAAFDASDWSEMSVRIGDTTLDLTRTGRPPVALAGRSPESAGTAVVSPVSNPSPAAAPPVVTTVTPASAAATAIAPGDATLDGHLVCAPSLGLFWRSPQPGAPHFVDVGQDVDAEDTVCIVEVMKLMNHVKAGVSGTVMAIEPENGQMVEFGQLLVVIRPHE